MEHPDAELTPPGEPAQADEQPPRAPQGARSTRSTRSRAARSVGILVLGAVLIFVADRWQTRAVDVELVHELPQADSLLPADVEVQVWQDETLLASATFFHPDSLASLDHTVVVPPGEYLVDYAIVFRFGEPGLRFSQPLTVEEPGRYYLRYELDDP